MASPVNCTHRGDGCECMGKLRELEQRLNLMTELNKQLKQQVDQLNRHTSSRWWIVTALMAVLVLTATSFHLQTNITNLREQYGSFERIITSLQGQYHALESNITSLQGQQYLEL